MIDFTFTSSNVVPDGTYYADFMDVAEYQDPENKYPPGVKWTWQIAQGEYSGKTISRVTGRKPGSKNACGSIITGLLGRTPKEGEGVDLKACQGQRYVCQVTKGRVETASCLPK